MERSEIAVETKFDHRSTKSSDDQTTEGIERERRRSGGWTRLRKTRKIFGCDAVVVNSTKKRGKETIGWEQSAATTKGIGR